MIKAKTRDNDLILGLSEENIKRLKEGKPILFELSEIYPEIKKGRCFIIYGKTEGDIVGKFEIGPDTKIKT